MKQLALLCVASGVFFSAFLGACAVRAPGYYGPPPYGRPGYGPPPYAGAPYGMAGCGLGAVLFGPVNTPGVQVLAASTNGTFGQTFGITSGTSNCVSDGVVRAEREQAAFAEINFQDLKRNMATGGGEFLTAFASLLGCDDAAKPALAVMTQQRYERILPSEATTPIQLVMGVKTEIKAHPRLASACSDERAVARAAGRPMRISSR
jgi:hypothetical protein